MTAASTTRPTRRQSINDSSSNSQQDVGSEEASSSHDGSDDMIQTSTHPHDPVLSEAGNDPSVTEEPHQNLPVHATNIPRVTCAILASLTTGGVSYAFGLYGNALKKNLHLSQAQLETISTATFFAGLFSWLPGMYSDRLGTRAGIVTGGITGATSLMLYWLVAKQKIQFDNLNVVVTILSGLSMGIFMSCALVTGAVFKLISCSCEARSKGKAVGVAKGLVGLGSGVYASMFQALRGPSTSDLDFLPMCAFFFLTAATIPSFFALPNKEDELKKVPDVLTPLHFRLMFGSLLVMALIIVGSALLELFQDKQRGENQDESTTTTTTTEPNYPLAGIILFVWWSPIFAQVFLPQRRPDEDMPEVTVEEQDALLANEDDVDDETPPTRNSFSKQQAGEEAELEPPVYILREHLGDNLEDDEEETESATASVGGQKTLFQMLQTYPAWLMLWTTTILVGGGTVETNNLGQMVESLHFAPVVTSASLSLFSVAQSGGRVATGALSDWALTWETRRCFIDRGVPRPFFLVVASVAGVIAHTILAISTEEVSFVIGIALSGLAFGSVWPLMVLITGEIYGTAHVGANYMFYDGFTSAAGTFMLSKVVAQEVYDRHLDPHYSDADDGATCYGQQCFQMTHVVIVVLSMICIGTSLVFQYATRERYNNS